MSCNNQTRSTSVKSQGKIFLTFYTKHIKRRKAAHQRPDLTSPLRGERTLLQLQGVSTVVNLSARVRLTRNVFFLPASKTPPTSQRAFAQLPGWALMSTTLLGKKVCETWRPFSQKLVTQLSFSAFLAAQITPSLLYPPPDLWHGLAGQMFFMSGCQSPSTFWYTHIFRG